MLGWNSSCGPRWSCSCSYQASNVRLVAFFPYRHGKKDLDFQISWCNFPGLPCSSVRDYPTRGHNTFSLEQWIGDSVFCKAAQVGQAFGSASGLYSFVLLWGQYLLCNTEQPRNCLLLTSCEILLKDVPMCVWKLTEAICLTLPVGILSLQCKLKPG